MTRWRLFLKIYLYFIFFLFTKKVSRKYVIYVITILVDRKIRHKCTMNRPWMCHKTSGSLIGSPAKIWQSQRGVAPIPSKVRSEDVSIPRRQISYSRTKPIVKGKAACAVRSTLDCWLFCSAGIRLRDGDKTFSRAGVLISLRIPDYLRSAENISFP